MASAVAVLSLTLVLDIARRRLTIVDVQTRATRKDNYLSQAREDASRLAVRVCGSLTDPWSGGVTLFSLLLVLGMIRVWGWLGQPTPRWGLIPSDPKPGLTLRN